jgi:hypothetical protein
MEKKLISTSPFTSEPKGKAKLCILCDSLCTQNTLFEVGDILLIEKYCETCVKKIKSIV